MYTDDFEKMLKFLLLFSSSIFFVLFITLAISLCDSKNMKSNVVESAEFVQPAESTEPLTNEATANNEPTEPLTNEATANKKPDAYLMAFVISVSVNLVLLFIVIMCCIGDAVRKEPFEYAKLADDEENSAEIVLYKKKNHNRVLRIVFIVTLLIVGTPIAFVLSSVAVLLILNLCVICAVLYCFGFLNSKKRKIDE